MIIIDLSVEKFQLIIKGHAQPEETEDYFQVCAGASMLAQGLAHSIAKFQKQQDGIRHILYRGDPGDMVLAVEPEPWAEATVRKRMRAYADGMELLALSNPESVTMIWDGVPVKPEEGEEKDE